MVSQELAEHFEFIKASQEHFFMIAAQDPDPPMRHQDARGGNDTGTVRPPINKITEQHNCGRRWIATLVVSFD
jgi:hypothetical protein